MIKKISLRANCSLTRHSISGTIKHHIFMDTIETKKKRRGKRLELCEIQTKAL